MWPWLIALIIVAFVLQCVFALGSKQSRTEDETERWRRLQEEMGHKPTDPED